MTNQCEKHQALIPLFLAGDLDLEQCAVLQVHAQSCAGCKADMLDLHPTFERLRESLTQEDPTFFALSRHKTVEADTCEKRGQVLRFPAVARQSIRPRRFGHWAVCAAAVAVAAITAFAGVQFFMGESPQEERRFQVASVTLSPAPRTLGGFPEYEIPPAYGLWLPLTIAPNEPAPPREIPDEDGMERFSYLAPPNYGLER